MLVIVVVAVRAAIVAGVRMAGARMTAPGQLHNHESRSGGDQQTADDRVLGALHSGLELQTDHDDQGSEHDREHHVSDPGQTRQSRDLGERITAGTGHHRQRHPVVGQDRVAEPDAGRGGEQRRRGTHGADVPGTPTSSQPAHRRGAPPVPRSDTRSPLFDAGREGTPMRVRQWGVSAGLSSLPTRNTEKGTYMSGQEARSRATDTAAPSAGADDLQVLWRKVVGRRSFLKQVGIAGAAAVPAGALAAAAASAKSHGPTQGDVAILRFLAAAEILETDLWAQYAELGGATGGNPAYIKALENLDGDMPQYISDNTDDERSHELFINAYLVSKGAKPVNLERFKTLRGSEATGANRSRRWLTNLKELNVDTSWYTRYRSADNPDFGASFPQAVMIVNQPAIQ